MGLFFSKKPSVKLKEFMEMGVQSQVEYIQENMDSKSTGFFVKAVMKETTNVDLIHTCLTYMQLHNMKDAVPLLVNVLIRNHKVLDRALFDQIFIFIEKYAKLENIEYLIMIAENNFMKQKGLLLLLNKNEEKYDEYIQLQIKQGNHELVKELVKSNRAAKHYHFIFENYKENPLDVFEFIDSLKKQELVEAYKNNSSIIQEYLAFMKVNIFKYDNHFVRQFFNLLLRFEVVDLDILYYLYSDAEEKEKRDLLSILYTQTSQYKIKLPKEHLFYELLYNDKDNEAMSPFIGRLDKKINFTAIHEKQKLKKQLEDEHMLKDSTVEKVEPETDVYSELSEEERRLREYLDEKEAMEKNKKSYSTPFVEVVPSPVKIEVEEEIPTYEVSLSEQVYLEPQFYFDYESEDIVEEKGIESYQETQEVVEVDETQIEEANPSPNDDSLINENVPEQDTTILTNSEKEVEAIIFESFDDTINQSTILAENVFKFSEELPFEELSIEQHVSTTEDIKEDSKEENFENELLLQLLGK